MSCKCKSTLIETVIKNDFKQTYTKGDIKKWISFGFDNNYINHETESNEIMDWIKLLSSENINVTETIESFTK